MTLIFMCAFDSVMIPAAVRPRRQVRGGLTVQAVRPATHNGRANNPQGWRGEDG